MIATDGVHDVGSGGRRIESPTGTTACQPAIWPGPCSPRAAAVIRPNAFVAESKGYLGFDEIRFQDLIFRQCPRGQLVARWSAMPSASTGTALPICRPMSAFDPYQR